jgi:hypothetical protein
MYISKVVMRKAVYLLEMGIHTSVENTTIAIRPVSAVTVSSPVVVGIHPSTCFMYLVCIDRHTLACSNLVSKQGHLPPPIVYRLLFATHTPLAAWAQAEQPAAKEIAVGTRMVVKRILSFVSELRLQVCWCGGCGGCVERMVGRDGLCLSSYTWISSRSTHDLAFRARAIVELNAKW